MALLSTLAHLVVWGWILVFWMALVATVYAVARDAWEGVRTAIGEAPDDGEPFECLSCQELATVRARHSSPPDMTDGPCPACADGPLIRLGALQAPESSPPRYSPNHFEHGDMGG